MVVLWSANYIVGKIVIAVIPPLLTAGLRSLISALAIFLVYRAWRRTGRRQWTRKDLPLLLGLGLTGVGINQIFFILGLSKTSVSHAAIIIGLTPILVLLMAAGIGQERLRPGRFIGMLVALGGVAILQSTSTPARGDSLLGDFCILMAAVTFAIFTVRGKAEVGRLGGVTVNTFAYIATAVAFLPLTFTLADGYDFSRPSPAIWVGLVYMAVFPSVVCYLIYYWALAWIPASRASALAYFQPLLATLFAIPTLGEYPTKSLIAGGVLVLFGVWLTERL
jgi:drug/metabolite transporter (DMT)-like permease